VWFFSSWGDVGFKVESGESLMRGLYRWTAWQYADICGRCVQIAVLTLGICVNCCDLNDYYEDIEMTRTMNAKEAKEADKRAARREESKASQLAEQMKEKYGKWTDKAPGGAAKK